MTVPVAKFSVLVVDHSQTEFCRIRDFFDEDQSFDFFWESSYTVAENIMAENSYDVFIVGQFGEPKWGLVQGARAKGCSSSIIGLSSNDFGVGDDEAKKSGADDCIIRSHLNYHYAEKSIRYVLERKKADKLAFENQKRLAQSLKMSALGELASGIAHEINNPLAIISTLSAVITHRIQEGGVDSEDTLRSVGKIGTMCSRISKILKGLGRFSRDEQMDALEPIYLKDLLEESLTLCSGKLKYQGLEIKTTEVSPDLKVLCRGSELIQVIVNLLNNAADAVTGSSKPWVKIESIVEGKDFFLKVTDSGIGVPQDIQEKILRPYFTTKEKGKGTGLGLSICKMIVEAHSGSLYLNNDSPNTQFVVRLPLDPTLRKYSVLVVDDEPDIRGLVAECLSTDDCTVFTAYSASEALSVLARISIDTIVTDINMPGISGMALAEEIYTLSQGLKKKPKLIFMTGNRPLHIPKKMEQELGACVFYKPFDLEHLKEESLNFNFKDQKNNTH